MDDGSIIENIRKTIQSQDSSKSEFQFRMKDGAYLLTSVASIKGFKGPSKSLPNQDNFNYLIIDEVPWSESSVMVAGVFDGHGADGHHVSLFVGTHLVDEIRREAFLHKRRSDFREIGLLRAFERVDEMVRRRSDTQDSGTTAIVVILCYEEIILANVGDSGAAFMFRDGTVKYVSRDHSPDDSREKRRIHRTGGAVRNCEGTHRVFNVVPETGELDGGLALSRAFGDLSLESAGVISSPDITSYPFGMRAGPDGWRERPVVFLLASDGLWDVVDEATIPQLVAESNELPRRKKDHPLTVATSHIANYAKSCWSVDTNGQYIDDITVMNIFLSYEDAVRLRDKDDDDGGGATSRSRSSSPRSSSKSGRSSTPRSSRTSTRTSTRHRLEKIEARRSKADMMTSEELDALIKRCTRDSNDCRELAHFSIVHETALSGMKSVFTTSGKGRGRIQKDGNRREIDVSGVRHLVEDKVT